MFLTKPIIICSTYAMLLACVFTPNANSAETEADQTNIIEHAAPGPDETVLYFERDGDLIQVRRQSSEVPALTRDIISTPETRGKAIVQALVDGPTESEMAAGVTHFLPTGSTLEKVETEQPDTIHIFLNLPPEFISPKDYTPMFVEETSEAFIESLRDFGFRQFYFYVKDPVTNEHVEIRNLLSPPDPPASPIPDKADAPSATTDQITPRNLPTQNGFVSGALTGKSVVLNSSHGWLDDNNPSRWRVQRSRYFGLLEDFSSAMFYNHYVIPLLQNAGARIRPIREPDSQTNIVVIDNAAGAPTYVEAGNGWATSTANGFIAKTTYGGNTVTSRTEDNPFGAPNGTRYVSGSTGAATASATYTPASIPASGYYNVYISYSHGANRTSNAHWQVHHSGGVTDFRINQKIGGGTWILLGNFYFEAGAPESQRKVVLLNDTGDTSIVSCDAVRFGGGMGNVARGTHGVSGRPRWQEEANNYLQYTGMLNGPFMGEVTDNVFYPATAIEGDYENPDGYDDEQIGWSNRPQYAQWEQIRDGLGNNLVYIGWHTNGLNGTTCVSGPNGTIIENGSAARGTGSYRATDASANANTENLTAKVHNAFIASVKQSYQATWQDRGIIKSNGYGESSQRNLGSVAGFFFEGLFHDNSADAAAYKDPKFRYAAARGIVHGLIEYYGGTVFPPEPVTNFRVKNIGNNQAQLEWTRGPFGTFPTHANGSVATHYRIFKSTNGYGFDNGIDIGSSTEYTLALNPGETTYLRVAAVNTAGISVPSETLVVRAPLAGSATVLVVNGYHRNDRFLAPYISASGIGGCTSTENPANTYRTFDPREFQSFNYTIQHAEAIAASGGFGIDSCSKDAINLGNVALTNYPMVTWIGGQQAEADAADGADDQSFKVAERNAIINYLEAGGYLFVSGSEIAWDFGRSGVAADKQQFLNNYLKAGYSADSSNTYTAAGNAGVFAGLGTISYDNGTGNTYQVRFPDVLTPLGGATACMTYSGGTGGTAAIQYTGTFGNGTQNAKLVYMGFGFETITNESVRNSLMSRVIDYFTPTSVGNWEEF